MSIVKKRKAEGFKTREAFEAAVDRIAELSVEVEVEEAELKLHIQELDAKFRPQIKAKRAEMDALVENAERYFDAHEAELVRPGTKSGETKLAFFGVRIGMPTVVKNIRDAWKSVAARWSVDECMKRFVRFSADVDKDRILSAFRDEKSVEDQNILRSQGFSVEQEPREFWVKARADEQVKAEK